ncbi:DUF2283 domain-containing protein [Sulfobacillus thermosulfidooxidans]|uniref:DUF2283 domain-containing protein n=1 Tax=Sulfobacillus thermosulfidooxidans TaxID=28034 RepID=UPI0009E90D7C|nr:DUF2283 domain-containing protein [Sulfobacillus thermosulfidooxidans]
MAQHYGPVADALYLTLRREPVVRSVALSPDILLDETFDRWVVGLEVMYPTDNWAIARTWLQHHGWAPDDDSVG